MQQRFTQKPDTTLSHCTPSATGSVLGRDLVHFWDSVCNRVPSNLHCPKKNNLNLRKKPKPVTYQGDTTSDMKSRQILFHSLHPWQAQFYADI